MARKIERLFQAPYSTPNGVQVTERGLWIVDQLTDRVALVEITGPHAYGATKILAEITSESSNTSGLTYGAGALWLAANGPGTRWRPPRPTDAESGDILQVDPETGNTLSRYPLPGGGGTHGIEYDRHEKGVLWVETLSGQTLGKVRIADWSVVHTVPLAYGRAHGLVRVVDGMWVVYTSDRLIVKLGLEDGKELDRIEVPESDPEPHGLSVYGNDLIYCDAMTGWVVKVTL